jgi:hypothetical protein
MAIAEYVKRGSRNRFSLRSFHVTV